MKRLGRIILNAFAALSLLLFLATMMLWFRSYIISDELVWDTVDHREFELSTTREGLRLSRRGLYISEEPIAHVMWERSPTCSAPIPVGRFPGCYHWTNMESEGVRVAWWVFAVVTAVLPSLRLAAFFNIRRRRRRLKSRGLCPVCNYDLRATPNRCPECGAVPLNSNA